MSFDPLSYGRATSALLAAKSPPMPVAATQRVTWVNPDDGVTNWTTSNCTVEADTSVYAPEFSQSLKVTTTEGGNGRIRKSLNLPVIGKYWRARVYIPDITKVTQMQFSFFAPDTSNVWVFTLSKANGDLVQGDQIFDMHFDFAYGGGRRSLGGTTPNGDSIIARVDCYVAAETGEVGVGNVLWVENVKRPPALIFINDEPYREFVDPVVPLLEQRGLPYQVQLRKTTVDDWNSTGASSGKASLAEYRRLLTRGCETGLHFNGQQATDAEFASENRALIADAAALGLLGPNWMASALQGQWTAEARARWAGTVAGVVRDGDAIEQTTKFDSISMMPPIPTFSHLTVPTLELNHETTAETAAGWVTNAIEKELLLSVFGHGAAESTEHRSPISVYQAFFEELDAHIGEFVPLTSSRLVAMYGTERDLRTRVSLQTYRPRVPAVVL